jgi:outer membrane immunogenic protein
MVGLVESFMFVRNLISSTREGSLMRRYLLGSIAALALGSASSAALAADIPPPEPVMTWTGFYLGAGGGVGWADVSIDHRRCIVDHHDDKECVVFEDKPELDFRRDFDESSDGNIIGIVQGGFDYEVAPSFVVGVGADWTFGDVLGIDRNHHDEFFGFDSRWENDGSSMVDVYGRAGFAPIAGSFLVYGLVGWSWLDVDSSFRIRHEEFEDPLFKNDDSFSANGLTFGGGVEWRFTENLSVRGEYRFTDLDNFDLNGRFEGLCGEGGCDNFRHRNDIDLDVQRVLFTLNWRFGGFGAATAAAY